MPGTTGAGREPGMPDTGRENKPRNVVNGVPDRAAQSGASGTGYLPGGRSATAPYASRATATLDAEHRERIERRAYQLYEQRGREPGHEMEDWLRAEQEVLGASRR
jgi:Protein of unknown function (DUF2934)